MLRSNKIVAVAGAVTLATVLVLWLKLENQRVQTDSYKEKFESSQDCLRKAQRLINGWNNMWDQAMIEEHDTLLEIKTEPNELRYTDGNIWIQSCGTVL